MLNLQGLVQSFIDVWTGADPDQTIAFALLFNIIMTVAYFAYIIYEAFHRSPV